MWFNPDPSALAAWDHFPAAARPRPIVISAPPLIPRGGFGSDGDAKLAALDGRYDFAATLPADPPATLPVVLSDGTAELPTRTAQQAVDALLATAPKQQSAPGGFPLRITRVELGTATFGSDRGPLALPAWLFTAPGATGPLAWPAVAESAFWPRGPSALVLGGGVRLGGDGSTVTINLPAPGPTCPGGQLFRFEPAALESASAVVVGLRAVPDGTAPGVPVPDCAVDAAGRTADYAVRLSAPLGGRVLLAPVGVGYTEVQSVVPG